MDTVDASTLTAQCTGGIPLFGAYLLYVYTSSLEICPWGHHCCAQSAFLHFGSKVSDTE